MNGKEEPMADTDPEVPDADAQEQAQAVPFDDEEFR